MAFEVLSEAFSSAENLTYVLAQILDEIIVNNKFKKERYVSQ